MGDTEIRPSFWSDNYFSLALGEAITTEVSVPARLTKGKQFRVVTSGLNVKETSIKVSSTE